MRGVLRLAEMAPRLVAEADKKSDATADKLQAAFAKHDAVNEQYSRLADQVNKNAEDALAALAPLTNGAPPISGEPQPS